MSDRRQRITAEEAPPEPKLWKLPFWTEPKHIIHVEEDQDDSEVLIEDGEIEIEVEPLTIEQLETIRQDAYNEGLEQGLVEGRQKGEKLGYDAGHVEGLEAGKTAGHTLGYEEGLEQGKKTALAEGEDKSVQLTSRIQANMRNIEKSINEQKSAIEKILPDLVISMAQVVISEELNQGSEHIVSLVNKAIEALPLDTHGLTIECNSLDLPFLEAAQEYTDFDAKFKLSENIQPGGCKVKSKYSSIDFTLGERWQAVIKQYKHQLQLGFSKLDEIQKDQTQEDEIEHADNALKSEQADSDTQSGETEDDISAALDELDINDSDEQSVHGPQTINETTQPNSESIQFSENTSTNIDGPNETDSVDELQVDRSDVEDVLIETDESDKIESGLDNVVTDDKPDAETEINQQTLAGENAGETLIDETLADETSAEDVSRLKSENLDREINQPSTPPEDTPHNSEPDINPNPNDKNTSGDEDE